MAISSALAKTELLQKLFSLLNEKKLSEDVKVITIMLANIMIKDCKGIELTKELEDELNNLLTEHKPFSAGIKNVISCLKGEEVSAKSAELPTICKVKTQIESTNSNKVVIEKKDVPEVKEELICVYCKKELDTKAYERDPYGLLASYTFTNFSKNQQLALIKEYADKYPHILNVKHNLSEPSGYGLYKTCGHYLHLQCSRYYLATNEKRLGVLFSSFGIIVCPFCESYSKLLLPGAFKEGITDQVLKQTAKALFSNRKSAGTIQLLEALSRDIVCNINLIDVIGLKEYLKAKHRVGKLLIGNAVVYFHHKSSGVEEDLYLSLIHICRCRRYAVCRSRWSPYH
eukprot:TRINITY_DN6695_c0_g1_i1.p1 TRINITY_DN6695_c0_g1~~TRINITY_DN6695_c0_g1_i1.p1  ORF type:complete len:378 (-),score=47.26 TRINITY_DN6695_c0_g1_i1:8-1036(-)